MQILGGADELMWLLHLISKRCGPAWLLEVQKEAGRKATTAALPGVSHRRSAMTVWEKLVTHQVSGSLVTQTLAWLMRMYTFFTVDTPAVLAKRSADQQRARVGMGPNGPKNVP